MYKIVGADNREYGPISRETILEWIAQGRANGGTIARLEDGAWKPLATFDEFKAALGSAAPPLGAGGTFSSSSVPPLRGTAVASRQANSMAVTGLVFSILGILCCPCLGPLLGLIFSLIGLNQIREKPNLYTTDATLAKIGIGLSIAGMILHCGIGIFGNGVHRLQHLIH